jgi:hypothetical protein
MFLFSTTFKLFGAEICAAQIRQASIIGSITVVVTSVVFTVVGEQLLTADGYLMNRN